MNARRKTHAPSASDAQPAPPPSNDSMANAEAAPDAPAKAAAVAAAVAEWRELRERIDLFNSLPVEVLQQVAKYRISWPVMAGKGKIQVRNMDMLLEGIALGSGVPIREFKLQGERKIPDVGNPINDIARLCLQMAMDERACGVTQVDSVTEPANLPELSPETARKWAIYCWGEFLKMFPAPELHPKWKTYGTHRNTRYTAGKSPKKAKDAELHGVNDGIREAFIAAVVRLVR